MFAISFSQEKPASDQVDFFFGAIGPKFNKRTS